MLMMTSVYMLLWCSLHTVAYLAAELWLYINSFTH